MSTTDHEKQKLLCRTHLFHLIRMYFKSYEGSMSYPYFNLYINAVSTIKTDTVYITLLSKGLLFLKE